MTVTRVQKDPEALTMTLTAEFEASIERVWELWENPRELERWWGPPTYPATFVDHDLTPGGHATYFMTGPEGDQPRAEGCLAGSDLDERGWRAPLVHVGYGWFGQNEQSHADSLGRAAFQ